MIRVEFGYLFRSRFFAYAFCVGRCCCCHCCFIPFHLSWKFLFVANVSSVYSKTEVNGISNLIDFKWTREANVRRICL